MRTPTRRLTPLAAGRTPVAQLEAEQFANRLQALRVAKGWSQSDLAREVWGEITVKNTGRKVARNRDRISTYEMGKSYPDPHNLAKLAKALGTTPEELAPDIAAATIERASPELAVIVPAGHSNQAHLKINRVVSFTLATQIVGLINAADIEAGRQ